MTDTKPKPRAAKRVDRRPVRAAAASAEVAAAALEGEQHSTPVTPELSKRWREPFFARLAETSNVAAACEHAGISRTAVYSLRRRDSAFHDRWMRALAEGYDNLEMDLLHQLRTGEAKDGPKFNPLAAMRMLQQHRENVTREKARRANVDAATVRAAIDRKIAEMRALVLADKLMAERAGRAGETDDDG
jgi:hypothetical protein